MNSTNENDPRQRRATALLQDKRKAIRRIVRQTFFVPSETHSGGYVVDLDAQSCTCPDFETWGKTGTHRCKHIRCATMFVQLPNRSDNLVTTKRRGPRGGRGERTPDARKGQWGLYNDMAIDRHRAIPQLLHEVIQAVPVPEQPASKRGAKPVDPHAVVYMGALKMLYKMSARNLVASMDHAVARSFIAEPFHYTTLQRELANPALTPLIRRAIDIAAAPLAWIEDKIIMDATGFSTCNHARWFDEKWGTPKKKRLWIKLHAATGFHTKVVMAARVTERYVPDGSMAPVLIDDALANGFLPTKGFADAAYLDQAVIRKFLHHNILPFIDFRSNTTGTSSQELHDLYERFRGGEKKYMAEYHARSIGETAFWMIKQNTGPALFSKGIVDEKGDVIDAVSQYNEVYLKCLVHNCWCLVGARHEFHPLLVPAAPASNDTEQSHAVVRGGTREIDFGTAAVESLELSA